MCTVSNNLKLCSCAIADFDEIKYYWELHRFKKGKDEMVVGEVMMPCFNEKVDHRLNGKTILEALNRGDAFDFEPDFRNKDLLHLAFKFDDNDWQHCNYGFEYKNGKWEVAEYDALMWMWHHSVINQGKIENATINE